VTQIGELGGFSVKNDSDELWPNAIAMHDRQGQPFAIAILSCQHTAIFTLDKRA
jgi:hypothetical protein